MWSNPLSVVAPVLLVTTAACAQLSGLSDLRVDTDECDGCTEGGASVDGGALGDQSAVSDPAVYGFETDTQGWIASEGIQSVTTTTAQAFAGTHALAVTFDADASTSPADASTPLQEVYVRDPSTPAGKTITFHVLCAADAGVSAIQPYVLQGAAGGWAWTGNRKSAPSFRAGEWNTLDVTVPPGAAIPLFQLGVQFAMGATSAGTCYVDSVGW